MTDKNKVFSLIGLATRARRVVSGEFSTEKSVKSGRSHMVIVSEEASDNTKKMFENVCQSVADYKNCVKENNRNNLVKACRNLSAGLFYMDVHYRREIYKAMENKQAYGLLEEERPKAKMIGEDGNIFNLMGIASRTLKSAGYEEKANEMFERITFNAKSYDEALNIISEYVKPVENYEESFQMKGFE